MRQLCIYVYLFYKLVMVLYNVTQLSQLQLTNKSLM